MVYLDLIVQFPFNSLDGNSCILVLYDYNTSAILVEPIQNFESDTIYTGLKEKFKYLEAKGYKSTFNVLDNQASRAIAEFLNEEHSDFKLVEPDNHHVNASECPIQTWKNHFIAGM